jgi:hypothetical protein
MNGAEQNGVSMHYDQLLFHQKVIDTTTASTQRQLGRQRVLVVKSSEYSATVGPTAGISGEKQELDRKILLVVRRMRCL